ncbi:MAG: hypothetical protein JRC86_11225 [Deltaproteobacteria bacterium]|nr:hypothetical protein [Deltaproteobacteria bacterium]
MKKYFPIFFMILGAADFGYGLYRGDRISLLIGGIIILIAVSIIRKAKQEEKNDSPEKKQ